MGDKTLKKQSTISNSLSNLNTVTLVKNSKGRYTEVSPIQESELDDDLPEVVDDDHPYLCEENLDNYRGKPVGQMLREQMERNKREPVRTSVKDVYDIEKDHIADPLSYCMTPPDIEIRYTKWKL